MTLPTANISPDDIERLVAEATRSAATPLATAEDMREGASWTKAATPSGVATEIATRTRGIVGDGGVTYRSVAAAQAAATPAIAEIITIETVGGRAQGAHRRIRSAAEPAGYPVEAKHQDAAGQWWVVAEPEVSLEMFGAANDGVALDDAALDAAYQWAMARPNGGTIRLREGDGYLMGAEHNLFPSKPLAVIFDEGARILVGFVGTGKIVLNFSHPTGATTYPKKSTLVAPRIEMAPSAPAGVAPAFIEFRRAGEFTLGAGGRITGRANNTLIRLSRVYNSDLGPIMCFLGGCHRTRKSTDALFSIASGSTALSADRDVFDASDIGRALFLPTSASKQMFTIASVTDARNAVTTLSAFGTATARRGSFEGVTCSTTGGSGVVTLESAVAVAEDVGRAVYIMGGAEDAATPGTPRYPHRATIVSVDGTTQITVSPTVPRTTTGSYVVFSPVVDIYSEPEGGTNDIVWCDLHVENSSGVQLVVDGAVNASFPRLKLHAHNQGVFGYGYNDDCTLARAIFSRVGSAAVSGDFEGETHNALGGVLVCGHSRMTFDTMHGIAQVDQPLIHGQYLGNSGRVEGGAWFLNNRVNGRTIERAISHTGSGTSVLKGPINAFYDATAYPYVLTTTRPPTGHIPSGAAQAAAAVSASVSQALACYGSGSPTFAGFAAGGTPTAPAVVADQAVAARLSGQALADAAGSPIEAARIDIRARSPSAGDLSGDLVFATRSGGALSSRWVVTTTGPLTPAADNAVSLGAAAYRPSVIYAATGAINTSDARDKTLIAEIPDAVLDAWGDVRWSVYKWRAAVEEKGARARTHAGLIAQQVRDAFAARGLDARAYALLCYDAWDAEPACEAVVGEDGEEIAPAVPARPAGDRWGVRIDQCLAIEAAWMRRELARLAARVAELERSP